MIQIDLVSFIQDNQSFVLFEFAYKMAFLFYAPI